MVVRLSVPVRVTRLLRLVVRSVLVRRKTILFRPVTTSAGIVRTLVVRVRLRPVLTLIPMNVTPVPLGLPEVVLKTGLNVWYGLY